MDPKLVLWIALPVLAVALWTALILVIVRRFRRVEERLTRLPSGEELRNTVAPLATIARVQALEAEIGRLTAEVARAAAPVHPEDLVPLRDAIQGLDRSLTDLRVVVHDRETIVGDPVETSEQKLRRALEQRGFEKIRLLRELSTDEGEEELRVPVEARRAGMSYKGLVTLFDGRVTEVALTPATEVFP